MLVCERCKKEKNESSYLKTKKSFCLQCRNTISSNKYKETQKGVLSQERFKSTEKYRQIHKRSNKKRADSGYFKNRYRNDEGLRKKENERRMQHHRANPKIKAERDKRHSKLNPEKTRSRGRLRMAVHRGTILKPSSCDKCKIESKRIEAHHHDYSKPFDVLWLCVECHKVEHGKLRG